MRSLVLHTLVVSSVLVACRTPLLDVPDAGGMPPEHGDMATPDLAVPDMGRLPDLATAPDLAAPPTCEAGTLPCGTECVDLFKDPQNCGACGRVCGEHAYCGDADCHACSQGLAPALTYPVGPYPLNAALGDVDRDGVTDVVVANWAGRTVSVLLGQVASDGEWTGLAAQQTFSTGRQPHQVQLGDVNGDGWLDAVTANLSNDSVSVLLGQVSDGQWAGFAAPVEFSVATEAPAVPGGSQPSVLALGDVNGDGWLDVVVPGSREDGMPKAHTVRVLLGQGQGAPGRGMWTGFAPMQAFVVGQTPYSVALGDVDGDGLLDVVTGNAGSFSVSVLRGQKKDGAWDGFAPKMDFPVGEYPFSVALGDLDGDGLLDAVTANTRSHDMSVLLGRKQNGAWAGFAPAQTVPNVNFLVLALGDVDGDSLLDVVGVVQETDQAVVLPGRTQGGAWAGFGPMVGYDVGKQPQAASVGDLNGDGRPDLITCNNGRYDLSVLASQTAPECR